MTFPDGASAPPIATTPTATDIALDLTTLSGERMTWNWTLEGPEQFVIALDSRTRRDYARLGPRRPGLRTAAEPDRQLSAFAPTGTNTVIESFWDRVQTELLNRRRWRTRIELANALSEYLEIFHNRRRRHSSLGLLAPSSTRSWTMR